MNTKKVNNVDTNNASGGLVNKIDAPSNGTNDTRSNKTNTVNQEESKIKPVANNVDNSGVLKKKIQQIIPVINKYTNILAYIYLEGGAYAVGTIRIMYFVLHL